MKRKLLDFYASWCGPCVAMTPIIEELSKEFMVEKIDVSEDEVRAAVYNVLSLPTFIVMDGDKEVARFTGVTSKEELEKALRV